MLKHINSFIASFIAHCILLLIHTQILLHESEWQAVATTSSANDSILIVNKTATYAQMMETLSNLASLKILAYRANVCTACVFIVTV